MIKAMDLTGKQFGKLTVLHKLDEKKHKQTIWLCQCECGKLVQESRGHLTSGHTKSCGCMKKTQARYKDLTGQIYGHYKVIEKTDKRISKYIVWKCQCTNCGNIYYMSTKALTAGNYRKCNCSI